MTAIETAVVNATVKTQNIRLFDVFLLGPFMVWVGAGHKNPFVRAALMSAGVGTITFNWKNYQTVEAEIAKVKAVLLTNSTPTP